MVLKKTVIIFLVFTYIIVSSTAAAQDRPSSTSSLRETGVWNGLYLKIKLSEKFGYYGEHHYRVRNSENNLHDFVGRVRQVYNRAGLNIFFNENFEAVIGPTLVFNYTPSPGNPEFEKVTLEPRIWHQWLFIMPMMNRFKIYHQLRFEHRWRRENNIDAVHDYTNRYRYKLFSIIPLNKKKIEEKTLYFSPSAEIFLQSGKSIVYNPFEDFRTYNGFGYVMNQNVTFFAGHMWTYGQRAVGFDYATSHIIRLNVMVGLDARPIERRVPSINLGY